MESFVVMLTRARGHTRTGAEARQRVGLTPILCLSVARLDRFVGKFVALSGHDSVR